MPSARLTRAVHFAAGHRYHRPEWSPQRNEEVFGPCAGAPGHGHNYRCEVTVEGQVDPATGMVADLGRLDRLLQERIVEPMDHAFLNEVEDFRGDLEIPTTENICRVVWNRLEPVLPDRVRLVRVRVHEDRDLWSEYAGG
ncbi:MAG: 6-pyruvoyl trahydropterin synthase family protein [Gemmatimonadota bacterium]